MADVGQAPAWTVSGEPGDSPGAPSDRPPRAFVFSPRRLYSPKWQAAQFEFEDLIGTFDDVELFAPGRRSPAPAGLLPRAARWARRHMQARQAAHRVAPNEQMAEHALTRDYELFFAVFHFVAGVDATLRLPHWRARCRKAVAFVVELWTPWVDESAAYVRMLEQFDHVFVFNPRAIPAIRRHAPKVPIDFLPVGLDAEAFCPHPDRSRVIDCLSIGRRPAGVHRTLLDLAHDEDFFYHYDTHDAAMPDHRAHRHMTATLLQRSRYSLNFKINEGRTGRTGGEEALSTRFFEAAAAGSIMLGSAPECPEYDALFDWPDAVFPIEADGSDLRQVLAMLEADPERMERARWTGVARSLQRFDWVHQWRTVLASVGLLPTARMETRAQRLHARAAEIERTLAR